MWDEKRERRREEREGKRLPVCPAGQLSLDAPPLPNPSPSPSLLRNDCDSVSILGDCASSNEAGNIMPLSQLLSEEYDSEVRGKKKNLAKKEKPRMDIRKV